MKAVQSAAPNSELLPGDVAAAASAAFLFLISSALFLFSSMRFFCSGVSVEEPGGFLTAPEEAEDGPPELYFVHGGHKASVSDFSWNPESDYMGVVASVDERNALQVWQCVDLDEEEEPADADLEGAEVETTADEKEPDSKGNKKSDLEGGGEEAPAKKARVTFV